MVELIIPEISRLWKLLDENSSRTCPVGFPKLRERVFRFVRDCREVQSSVDVDQLFDVSGIGIQRTQHDCSGSRSVTLPELLTERLCRCREEHVQTHLREVRWKRVAAIHFRVDVFDELKVRGQHPPAFQLFSKTGPKTSTAS